MVGSLKYLFANTYGDSLVEYYANQQIYLKRKVMDDKKINVDDVFQKAKSYLINFDGVAGIVSGNELSKSNSEINSLIQKGYNPKRSGDLIINLQPGWVEWDHSGTTHGSPYSYDTHVPLIWYGWEINQGHSSELINITDIAPTLADFLNIQAPNGCIGKPIPFLTK
jgi:hypothetical protein